MDEESKARARQALSLRKEEADILSQVELAAFPPRHQFPSFFESLFLRGIKVDRIETGVVVCSFKVPPLLTGSAGALTPGAIADLVDMVGAFAATSYGIQLKATVNLSIQFLSSPKIDDELEIIARVLNHERSYSNTSICLRKKKTGEVVANCQQLWSLTGRSKI
ncbi:hypothetical protein H6P81_006788 [Aristolochia fimbriata]|uniref:Thioesterase domain-containing protein n=1 Tax=Aristolochia fimbriata TaxID=158543 RepID=A0AAV7EZ64_ARIFI|nr:hypothetical protein H6P81_006788 [Aristolochia fimbriata]